MKLPDGNGTDVLRTVRETNPEARTVVITGYADEMATRVEEALAEGANAVALKPFDVPQLLNMVTTMSTPHPERREAQ
jgi:ActR/RegA family two-component response regulator